MPYCAVVLNEESRTYLINKVLEEFKLPEWDIIAHHMTIEFSPKKDTLKKYEKELGQSVFLSIDGIAVGNNVVSLVINRDCGGHLSQNKIPHITFAVDRENGGKPVMSNNFSLEEYKPFQTELLRGTIEICD